MTFSSVLGKLEQRFRPSRPLIEVGISKENLLHNLHTYQKQYPHLLFAPVLKSNAYGHGLCVIAKLLDKERIAFFMVDSLYEARTLRQGGIRSRIVVVGFVRPEDIAANRLRDIDFALVDLEQLRAVAKRARRSVRIHLKLDTGMHRQGILPEDIPEALRCIASNQVLRVTGVCSHLADADGPNSTNTDAQLRLWNENLAGIQEAFPTIEYTHLAATKGIAWAKAAHTTVARLGIGLYGFDTAPDGYAPVRPVLEVRTLITSVRRIPAGDFVGYNATYEATKPVRIATVPIGYSEGIDRGLSNTGSMRVNGLSAPLAGRVSMNMSSLDITDIPHAAQGDTVIAISRNLQEQNSVAGMARQANTTPYVILTHIPQHLRRIVE